MAEKGHLRIGELSRRVGESPELLRAWEARYGLVTPGRTAGGLRLYTEEDERRIRVMQGHIAAGLSAAEAARLAKRSGDSERERSPGPSLTDIAEALEGDLDALDEPQAQATLDRLFAASPLESALSEVLLPFLHRLGDRWATAHTTVAQEHFASNVIGGRLRGLARGWGAGVGPRALLACPPREQHELGLMCFGLLLRQHGWRIAYLGAETPVSEIASALDQLAPEIVILAAVSSARFLDRAEELRALSDQVRVVIGGAGGSSAVAELLGVEALGEDIVRTAATLVPRGGARGTAR